jgi:hypothetical protein
MRLVESHAVLDYKLAAPPHEVAVALQVEAPDSDLSHWRMRVSVAAADDGDQNTHPDRLWIGVLHALEFLAPPDPDLAEDPEFTRWITQRAWPVSRCAIDSLARSLGIGDPGLPFSFPGYQEDAATADE